MALDKLTTGQAVPRKYLAHYINATPSSDTPTWTRLGEDLEEYSVEYSADVETVKNILGETKTRVKDYEVSASADPYYASVGDELYSFLENIARKRLTLDACKTQVLTVYLWQGESGAYVADEEEAIVEITSLGGDTNGVNIPFTVHMTGKITAGTFNETTKVFTETKA